MATLILFLAVLFAAASIVFSSTCIAALGYPDWINDACSSIPLLCNDTPHLALTAAALGTLWVAMKFTSFLRS
jgi:hypothetical protein